MGPRAKAEKQSRGGKFGGGGGKPGGKKGKGKGGGKQGKGKGGPRRYDLNAEGQPPANTEETYTDQEWEAWGWETEVWGESWWPADATVPDTAYAADFEGQAV